MTATERLRQLLDERGVKWYARNILSTAYVHWGDDRKGPTFDAKDAGGGKVDLFCYRISPEQAVEATLGRGTCKDKCSRFNAWVCSECGATVLLMFDDYGEPSYSVGGVADVPHFCPNCGKKVVE